MQQVCFNIKIHTTDSRMNSFIIDKLAIYKPHALFGYSVLLKCIVATSLKDGILTIISPGIITILVNKISLIFLDRKSAHMTAREISKEY